MLVMAGDGGARGGGGREWRAAGGGFDCFRGGGHCGFGGALGEPGGLFVSGFLGGAFGVDGSIGGGFGDRDLRFGDEISFGDGFGFAGALSFGGHWCFGEFGFGGSEFGFGGRTGGGCFGDRLLDGSGGLDYRGLGGGRGEGRLGFVDGDDFDCSRYCTVPGCRSQRRGGRFDLRCDDGFGFNRPGSGEGSGGEGWGGGGDGSAGFGPGAVRRPDPRAL